MGPVSPTLATLLARSARHAAHPIARAALDEVKERVDAYEARIHEPLRWALFHERMAKSLRETARNAWQRFWRAGAIAHHERMARVYAAHAWALDGVAAAACGVAPGYAVG